MGAVYLASMPAVLRKAGLKVELFPGYETRSRSTGGLDGAWAIGVHHDAIPAHVPEVNRSRSGWTRTSNRNRPVGTIRLNKDGTCVIGSLAATNTQGRGGPVQTSKGYIGRDMGNRYFISIEPSNDGVGEAWPIEQQDAYITLCAALMLYLDLKPGDIFAHFEWAPGRKFDPAGPSMFATQPRQLWNMDDFRGGVWLRSIELVETGRAWGSKNPAPAPDKPAPTPERPAPTPKPKPAPVPDHPPVDLKAGVYGDWPLDNDLPVLRNGSRSDSVKYLQSVLKYEAKREIVIDGIFGNQTERELKAVQWYFQIPVDGICGWGGSGRSGLNPGSSATWPFINMMALNRTGSSKPTPEPEPTPKPPPFDPAKGLFSLWPLNENKPYTKRGSAEHDATLYIQGVILHKAGGGIAVDGDFGPQTERRVREVQQWAKVWISSKTVVDGEVGPQTWGIIDWLTGT